MDNCEILIENIKCFMFDLKGRPGISHRLKFVRWGEDHSNSFIVADRDGNKYRIKITEE